MNKTKAAVIGLGYWGPNLARNFQASDAFELVAICDSSPARLEEAQRAYPWSKGFLSAEQMLREAQPEIVAVCTPVASHHGLVRASLLAGAHVLCEKPLAASVREAAELVELADRQGQRLFVDHTFDASAVRTIRAFYEGGELGELVSVDSVRINLGRFQSDVDVVWDLAPHDLAILRCVVEKKIESVRAVGSAHNPWDRVDVAHVDLRFEGGLSAHLHLSWLSPVKVRRTTFGGTKASVVYDDLEAGEKVKIYDRAVTFDGSDVDAPMRVGYRRGGVRSAALGNREALATQLVEISRALRGEHAEVSTGEDGLETVRILEASRASLAQNGASVRP